MRESARGDPFRSNRSSGGFCPAWHGFRTLKFHSAKVDVTSTARRLHSSTELCLFGVCTSAVHPSRCRGIWAASSARGSATTIRTAKKA